MLSFFCAPGGDKERASTGLYEEDQGPIGQGMALRPLQHVLAGRSTGWRIGVEPVGVMRRSLPSRSNLYSVAGRASCTMIPLAAVGAQAVGPFSESGGLSLHACRRFTFPIHQASTAWRRCDCQAAINSGFLSSASSMTTPAVTYFHSATSSLRASATIVRFLKRPSFCCTRSLNHLLSADPGW